jgi:hypothetical protein
MRLAEKLEHPEKKFRVVVNTIGMPLDLEVSTCQRYFWPDGTLFELVKLGGCDSNLPAKQLEEFISRHPISTGGERNAHGQAGGWKS